MKKVLVMLCVFTLMLGVLSGCGKDDNEVSLDPAIQEETSEDQELESNPESLVPKESAEQEDSNSSSNVEKVKQFVEESQSAIELINEQYKDLMTTEMAAEGDAVVYTYTLINRASDVAAAKKMMDDNMQAQKAAMDFSVNAMKLYGINNPVILVRYLNSDGTEISTYEFK